MTGNDRLEAQSRLGEQKRRSIVRNFLQQIRLDFRLCLLIIALGAVSNIPGSQSLSHL